MISHYRYDNLERLDTASATRSSGWTAGTNRQDYGANYRYTGASTSVRWHRWTPTLTRAGNYDVYTWYVTNTGNTTTAPFSILHAGVTDVVTVNQRVNGGRWVLLGRFHFSASGGEYVQLSNANGRVTADAIKLVYADPLPPPSSATNIYYLHTDHLGTPRTASDANKKLIWRWDSDPYGLGAANDDPDNDGVKVTLNLRFPGQYFDAESGLHYNYHRYYDPVTGRYVTSDPIGLEGGLNTYGYVGGNPVRFTDPSGLEVRFGDRALPEAMNIGTHSYLQITPNDPAEFLGELNRRAAQDPRWRDISRDVSLGTFRIGGYPEQFGVNETFLMIRFNYEPPGSEAQYKLDAELCGQCNRNDISRDTEFSIRLIEAALDYDNGNLYDALAGQERFFARRPGVGLPKLDPNLKYGNCHTVTSALLRKAGYPPSKIPDPWGVQPGLHLPNVLP